MQIIAAIAADTAAITLVAANIPGTASISIRIVPPDAACILILLGRMSLDILHGLDQKLGSIGNDVVDDISSFSCIGVGVAAATAGISAVGVDIVPITPSSNNLGPVKEILAIKVDTIINRCVPVTASRHLIGTAGTRRVGRRSRRLGVNREGVEVVGVEAAYAGDFGYWSVPASPAASDDVGVAGTGVHHGMWLLLLL